MSASSHVSKVTVPSLAARKGGERISALTAYDYPTGWLVDQAGIDVVLVGDSLANTALGYPNTIPVELAEMLAATRAVRRGVSRSLLVGDMPFGSYHGEPAHAVDAAVRFLKAGAEAVKLEGGRKRVSLVRRLVDNEIPVMGHIGLTPQSVHAMGGYRVQGRSESEAAALLDDAEALQKAGAFALVIEGVPAEVGAQITGALSIPTIGIGAGPHCDGQILVLADVLGLAVPVPSASGVAQESQSHQPKFVRQYIDLKRLIVEALERYRVDVQRGDFPSDKESYHSPMQSVAQGAGTRAGRPRPYGSHL